MEAGLEDYQVIVFHEVDQAVLLGDAPGPTACQHVAQWFWLADTGEGIAQRVVDTVGGTERAVR